MKRCASLFCLLAWSWSLPAHARAALSPSQHRQLKASQHRGINALLGDHSYLALKGKRPTEEIPESERIQLHLRFVGALLKRRTVAHLTKSQKASRAGLLEQLKRYRKRGSFPKHRPGVQLEPGIRAPLFIGANGIYCAVGHLLLRSGHGTLAHKLHRSNPYTRVLAIRSKAFHRWQRASGFTLRELAMIQPGYRRTLYNRLKGKKVRGKRHGLWRTESCYRWFGPMVRPQPNVYIRSEGRYNMGLKVGLWRSWRATEKRSNKCHIKALRKKARLSFRSFYVKGRPHGPWFSVSALSGYRTQGYFHRGKRHQRWMHYNPKGVLYQVVHYDRGRKHGAEIHWYVHKARRWKYYQRYYRAGRLFGWALKWDYSGYLKHQAFYTPTKISSVELTTRLGNRVCKLLSYDPRKPKYHTRYQLCPTRRKARFSTQEFFAFFPKAP